MKILICEDDTYISDLLEIILSQQVQEVIKYEHIPTLEELKVMCPDLIIFDYWINGEKADGIISQIREEPEIKNIPIILISAIDQLNKIAAQLKVDKAIKKPFDITAIQEAVKNFSK
jgi:response regulator RpfG family c-di-GMP phosphodiesterase